ncbi:hypothetical protein DBV15_12847 [Temnothorax longispinosus]|uniref:Uncharacterized protein n=1 Tax=Temnothorax longispinosus TaxID=300112 RepID=A0A4S2L4S0_9HYME|nr:hypothetical protein DBV15_12847 [Temnothorax longispinosus]
MERIERKWWSWDEEKEVLIDGRGSEREEQKKAGGERGTEKKGKSRREGNGKIKWKSSEEGGETMGGVGGEKREKRESKEEESVVRLRGRGKEVRESRVWKVKRSEREEKNWGRGRKECWREKEGKEQKGSPKIGFWDVAGVKGKQEGF